ncbi:MAG: energy transducer TonB [Chthoniobacterales bacterium]
MKCRLLGLVFLSLSIVPAWGIDAERYVEKEPLRTPEYAKYFDRCYHVNYPDKAYAMHKTGVGTYRITINPQTGAITEVKIVKSTGVKILDDAAAVTLLQWKAKPHMLDHATLTLEFNGPGERTGTHVQW